MKAFAIHTIQRGKKATPRIIPAGKVFEATEAELLHLTPQNAVRKPTDPELAQLAWEQAEARDSGASDAAKRAVAEEFGGRPSPKPEPAPVETAPALTAAQKKAKAAEEAEAAAKVEAEKAEADAKAAAAAAADLTV